MVDGVNFLKRICKLICNFILNIQLYLKFVKIQLSHILFIHKNLFFQTSVRPAANLPQPDPADCLEYCQVYSWQGGAEVGHSKGVEGFDSDDGYQLK